MKNFKGNHGFSRITRILFCLLIPILLLLPLGGCAGGGEFAAGAAAGGALTGTVMAMQQHEEDLIARKAIALQQMEQAVTETEKMAAQAQIEALEKQLLKNEETMLLLKAGQAAAGSDWTDPDTVGSLSTTAAILLATWYLKKKGKKT